jgi:antitoxin CptB
VTGDPLSSPLLRPGAARERDGEEPCLPRLRWRCRRGLLELDLALQAFLDRGYIALDPCERAAFRRLLDTSDVQLQAWLLGQEEAPEYEFRELIKKIR